jgi:hypothetical protein
MDIYKTATNSINVWIHIVFQLLLVYKSNTNKTLNQLHLSGATAFTVIKEYLISVVIDRVSAAA